MTKSHRWIWFFAVVAVLAIAGITIQIVYNARQQLKEEDLDRAATLWQEKGPRDYDLTYVKKIREDKKGETFHVKVRDGEVVDVTLDGRDLEPQLYEYSSMKGLFADIRGFLRKDAEPNSPRAFVVAKFDAKDGHLVHYLRSVSRTRERVEISAKLKPLSEKEARRE